MEGGKDGRRKNYDTAFGQIKRIFLSNLQLWPAKMPPLC